MVTYMDKMDKINAFEQGCWHLPPDAVCSAMHVVTRPSDVRAFERDGTPLPVRTVIDLTKSGVNETLPDWPFRMEGVDAGVRLLKAKQFVYLGKTDLSKYYPSLGLHPDTARLCWVKDPRASTTWGGSGPPTQTWLDYQAKRRASRVRIAPFRRCSGVPLGLKPAPPFASALSGEMIQFLTSLGLNATMYVDDMMCAADTIEQCRADMATAVSVFKWLGLKCNPDKQEGPARRITWLGHTIDTVDGTITLTADRRAELTRRTGELIAAGTARTKELESFIGKLGFCASVMRGGKAYLYRLRQAHKAAADAIARSTTLDAGALAGLHWWHARLSDESWFGSRVLLINHNKQVITVKSDASGDQSGGWGYVHDGALHWSRRAGSVEDHHTQFKEMAALVHCCE